MNKYEKSLEPYFIIIKEVSKAIKNGEITDLDLVKKDEEIVLQLENKIKNNSDEKQLFVECIKYVFYMDVLKEFDAMFGKYFYSGVYHTIENNLVKTQKKYVELSKNIIKNIDETDLYMNMLYMIYNNKCSSFETLESLTNDILDEIKSKAKLFYVCPGGVANKPTSLVRKLNFVEDNY